MGKRLYERQNDIKVKLFLCLSRHCVMKAYRRNGGLVLLILNLDGG
jgi:hypothetical protein